jgi:hypothetical protein
LNGKRQVFQGVIICDNCYKLVSHAIKRTQGELKMLFTVYTDMIRVGLLKGEFRPPVMPAPGKTLPQSELAKAMQEMAKRGDDNAQNSKGPVPDVSGDKDDTDGAVHGWRDTEAVSGRR